MPIVSTFVLIQKVKKCLTRDLLSMTCSKDLNAGPDRIREKCKLNSIPASLNNGYFAMNLSSPFTQCLVQLRLPKFRYLKKNTFRV